MSNSNGEFCWDRHGRQYSTSGSFWSPKLERLTKQSMRHFECLKDWAMKGSNIPGRSHQRRQC
jgi:hypothetical protein